MLSFVKDFERVSFSRQTIVVFGFIVVSLLGSSMACCLFDVKINGRTSFGRGMMIALRVYSLVYLLILKFIKECSIPLKSIFFVSHYKYTKKQRQFIDFYVGSLCEYLQIDSPELCYYKTRYTRIETELTNEGVMSILNIGTSTDSLQTLCYEIARELRCVYQLDRINNPEFIRQFEDDEYIVGYLNKIGTALELSQKERDNTKLYKLFSEIDADGFATVILYYLFRNNSTDIIKVHFIERNDEEIPMEDIFDQAKSIMANEDVKEYLQKTHMKNALNEQEPYFER